MPGEEVENESLGVSVHDHDETLEIQNNEILKTKNDQMSNIKNTEKPTQGDYGSNLYNFLHNNTKDIDRNSKGKLDLSSVALIPKDQLIDEWLWVLPGQRTAMRKVEQAEADL